MNSPHRTATLAAVLCLIGTMATAADSSFIDCAKAEKSDEKTICADSRLLQDDAQMTTLYHVAIRFVGMGTRGELQDAQVAWLEARHACQADKSCLRSIYASRVERLQKIIDGIAARGPF